MSSPIHSTTRLGQFFANLQPAHIAAALLVIILASVISNSKKKKIDVINPPAWFQPSFLKQVDYIQSSREIISKGREKFGGKAFRIFTDLGEIVLISPEFAHEIRNNPLLNFRTGVLKDFHTYLPGFAPFGLLGHPSEMLQSIVRKHLTKYLNTVTEPLAKEASHAFDLAFGNSTEWQSVTIKSAILDAIARLSSRVFLGEEVCRHEPWLKITREYTLISFITATKLNMFPSFLRPLVYIFDSDCRRLRKTLTESRAIIMPVIEKRRKLKATALTNGEPAPVFNDAIDWAESECKDRDYDAAALQLTLSFAAIHTTTDLLTQTLIMLAKYPEFIDPLRKEIIHVLTVDGWKKNALYNMKLLDSAIKETQRNKPSSMLGMRRLADGDVTLSDGTFIRKGQRLAIDDLYYRNTNEKYEKPDEFDIYRFRRLRDQLENEHKAQLVSTGPEQLSFGHGKFACPGRFFAANEIKIGLIFLLLKYDWKLADGTPWQPLYRASALAANPATVLQYRRRKEEIDLDDLKLLEAIDEE